MDDVIVLSPEPLPDLPTGTREFVASKVDEGDVLGRFAACIEANPCDYVVRLTSDCPLLDPHLIEYVVAVGVLNNADYCSNVLDASFPDGVDVELISAKVLTSLNESINSDHEREHVTAFLRRPEWRSHPSFNLVSIVNDEDLSKVKLSIDTEADLERVRKLEGVRA